LELPAPALGPGRPNLVLTGFSATGKSSAGALAADLLEMPFVDLDRLLERRHGAPVRELFAARGEPHFRRLEVQLLDDVARLSGTVVATGGGTVLHPERLAALARGSVVIDLTASPEEIERRLGDPSLRPLLARSPGRQIRELLAERGPAYAAAGEPLETASLALPEVARLLGALYRERTDAAGSTIEVVGPRGSYPVAVGRGSVDRLPALVAERLPEARRLVIVSDLAVAGSAGERVASVLRAHGHEVASVTAGRGEASKRIGAVSGLWDRFQELRVDRSDAVVAVGGGAGLDAVGFAAATWARGVPLVNVPTTVLAMVDASIGGKVAIDRQGAKNSVGAFHHPQLVVSDPELLWTLPATVARDGLAEVVKCAALASPVLLELLEEIGPGVVEDLPRLSWMIEQAVRIKAAYVAADPEDHGLRQALNLGHTYAHGLEAATDYSLPHGRAVAVGLVAASRLGTRLGLTPPELAARLEAVLLQMGLRGPVPQLDRAKVREAVLGDKKRRAGEAVFVVPTAAGAALVGGIDPESTLEPLWELLTPNPPPASKDPLAVRRGSQVVTEGAG
jgi:3-dehydroquinate synthase